MWRRHRARSRQETPPSNGTGVAPRCSSIDTTRRSPPRGWRGGARADADAALSPGAHYQRRSPRRSHRCRASPNVRRRADRERQPVELLAQCSITSRGTSSRSAPAAGALSDSSTASVDGGKGRTWITSRLDPERLTARRHTVSWGHLATSARPLRRRLDDVFTLSITRSAGFVPSAADHGVIRVEGDRDAEHAGDRGGDIIGGRNSRQRNELDEIELHRLAATSIANRVLPTPPTPLSVTIRCARRRSATSRRSRLRPTSGVR